MTIRWHHHIRVQWFKENSMIRLNFHRSSFDDSSMILQKNVDDTTVLLSFQSCFSNENRVISRNIRRPFIWSSGKLPWQYRVHTALSSQELTVQQRYLDVSQTLDALSVCFYDNRCDFVIFFALVRVNFSFRVRLISFVSSRRCLIAIVYRDFERTNSWRSRVWSNRCYIVLFQLSFQSSSLHRCKCFFQFCASFSSVS